MKIPAKCFIIVSTLILGLLPVASSAQDLFKERVTYLAGTGPLGVYCADLNDDTSIDIAVANRYSNDVSIFINDGTGAFFPAVSYSAGGGPRCVYGADIDGDDDIDLAVTNWETDNVSVLKNNGNGTFEAPVNYGAGDGPHWLYLANLDSSDTNIDMVVVNAYSQNVNIFVNNGDGTFTNTDNYSVGNFPHGIYCADLDNDGDNDMAVSNANSNSVSVLMNNGDATFLSAVNYTTQTTPYAVFASDLNKDDNVDLVATNSNSNSVSVFLNNGNGTFADAVNYTAGTKPYFFYCEDLDLDEDIDIAIANHNSNDVTVLLNNGDGTFGPPGSYNAGYYVHAVYCGDFDGDTDPDIAAVVHSNDSLALFFNRTYEEFVVSNLEDSGPGSFRKAISDANSTIGPDTITSTISGTIALQTPLPVFTDDSTVILGTTAPGGTGSLILDGSVLTKSANSGLVLASSYNFVEGLTLTGFDANGIEITGGTSDHNTLSKNLIYDNGLLGIDLGDDGVTANDAGDGDAGPNGLLNFPEIDSVFMNPDSTFAVYGKAADSATIEFFVAHPAGDSTRPADPSGYGEAREYIGSDTCDENGEFVYTIPNSIPQFSKITATATDTFGNTSEFCGNFVLTSAPLIIVGYSPINLQVTDPAGDSIGLTSSGTLFQTISPASYTETGYDHDSVYIDFPLLGEYIIDVIGEDGALPGALYSMGIRIDGTANCVIVVDALVPAEGEVTSYSYEVEEGYHYINGDVDRNEIINLLDILYLIDFKFKDGPQPYPLYAADANCDLTINLLDILYLIDFKFKEGPAPCPLIE